MTPTHRIPLADFDALAAGGGRIAGVLRSSQASRRLLLIRTVVDTASREQPVEYTQSGIEDSYAMLAEWHRVNRAAVTEVLLQPQVGAWGMRCLRRLLGAAGSGGQPGRTGGVPHGEVPLAVDLGHLACVVASAAVRAEVDFEIQVPVRDGLVQLPTLGAAVVGRGRRWCVIRGRHGTAAIDGEGVVEAPIRVGATDDTRWLPVRRLRSVADGLRFDVALEDVDPFRDFGELPAEPRLAGATVHLWQQRLDDAWHLLVRHHRHRAEVISEGVASLVPLRPPGPAQELSVTSGDAFGAVALTAPGDGLTLAVALVHETQHGKLSALLDLVQLVPASSDARHYAPWRADPRPVKNLLQGCYAYLGITDFWHVQRSRADGAETDGGRTRRQADFEFARWRQALWGALDTITQARLLTDLGTRFVTGMRASLRPLLEAPVAAWVEALSSDVAAGHRASWGIRNLRPDAEQIERAARAWVQGNRCPWRELPRHAIAAGPPGVADVRLDLAHLRLRDPDRFSELASTPFRLVTEVTGATTGDVFLVVGDYAAAVDGYLAEIAQRPDHGGAWAGLAVAAGRVENSAREPLHTHPQIMSALYHAICRLHASTPDPRELSRWIADAVTVRRAGT